MSEPFRPTTNPKKIPKSAWIVGGVVAVGAVYWAYKKNSVPAATDTSTQDTSGLGDLSGGGAQGTSPSAYGYYDPTTGTFIAPGIQQNPGVVIAPSTTQAWTQQAMAYLAQQGIDTTSFLSGVYNWLYGPNRLSQAEYNAVEQAIAAEGKPPGITTVPILAPANQTPTGTGHVKYEVERHQISAVTSGRALVQRFSDPSVSTPTNIEVALRATGIDPRNARYMPYYGSHGGRFQAGANLYVHVVKKA
jgi:hypothetical protein